MDPTQLPDLFALKTAAPPRPRRGHAVLRHAFVPAFLVLAGSSVAIHARAVRLLQPAAMTGALLMWIAIFWLAEHLYPAHREWSYRLLTDGARGWARFGRDLFYLVYVTLLTALLVQAASHGVHAMLAAAPTSVRGLTTLWPSHAPWLVRASLAFLLVELFSYWLHRAAHRFRLLWQFHSTHHVVSELGGIKALRTHPVDNVLFYFARTVPLMLLGAGPEELVAATYLGGVLGLLAHANLRVSEGGLGWLVNLPQFHWIHHSAEPSESNANFGCHTILWDRLFGTFRREPQGPLEIGVRPLGMRTLWQELGWPFYRSVSPPSPGDPPS